MRLPEVCIERPVLTTVMSLAIVIVGAIALLRLPNRELPDVDPPVVSVTTVYLGAAPEVVETSVTQVLEDQLIGIEGIKHVTSVSREQVSQISVEFELYRDVDAAAADVRDRVARARSTLPQDVEEPVIAKRSADARPIQWIALFGGGLTQIELSTLAETQLRDRLAKLPGVAEVWLAGERRYAMRLWIDNTRLTGQGLTIADVAAALKRENVDIPSGRIEGSNREFTVRTPGEMKTPEEYESLILAETDSGPVRLRDVGRAEVGAEDDRKLVGFNGVPAVALGIVKQSKANTLDVADAVRAELAVLGTELPEGVKLDLAFDSSIFVKRSIEDVSRTIFEAIVLVVIVIYLFLRSARATLLPAVAIPVSIVGTFAVLYALNFSINTLTLMGVTLAIGLVVDDAIVVLENITRWIEEGTPRMEAARRGMNEILFAVMAATASTVAVFLPLAFLTDTTGRLFREFGVTVAAAVAISGFVAITLTPALGARVLSAHTGEHGFKALLARGFERISNAYTASLRPALARPLTVVAIGAAWVALGFLLLAVIPREFVPAADRGVVLSFVRAPEGSTMDYTARYQKQIEQIVLGTPEVAKSFSVVSLGMGGPGLVNEGVLFTSLKLWEDRDRSQQEVVEEWRGKFGNIAGVQAFPVNPDALGQSLRSAPVSLVVQGPDIYEVARYADEIANRARGIPGLVNLQSDLLINKPQLEVAIDRNRASDLGVSARDIASTLQILLAGQELSTFKLNGQTYKVMVQLEQEDRADPRAVLRAYVRSSSGRLMPLASFVDVRESVAPRGLPHYDRIRSATISGNLASGAALGTVLERISATAKQVLPEGKGYKAVFSGDSEQFYASGNALLFAYLLAIVAVYLVLAAQFESFLHPVTILVAVALSFTGALVTLMAVGSTLNLFSQIGLVMLVGLVTKNSILIVEFANQLRDRGLGPAEAVFESSRIRFRPILMTALATMAGILPIAIGSGAGGESRAPLGIAVVGGVGFSTVLTFIVVPAVYLAFEGLRERLTRRARAATADAPESAAAPARG
jgi:multidrug efflux pump